MRSILAGLFVFAGLLVAVASVSNVVHRDTPPWLVGLTLSVLLIGLCFAALVLFNRRALRPSPGRSPVEHALELESRGLLASADFRAQRAFQVAEFEDEGSHYFIELEDGAVLYLSGQYLYEYEPIDDDPGLNRPRTFPCTEFRIRRHRTEGYAVDIQCRGRVLEPEIVAPHFPVTDFRQGAIPEDGQILRDRSYDQLKLDLTASKE